jgi:hypothetical protein
MTNGTQDKTQAQLHRETEVILRCLDKSQTPNLDPLMEDLEQVRLILQWPPPPDPQVSARNSDRVHRLLVRAMETITRYDHMDARRSTLKGVVYLYRGVFLHQQSDWMRASDEYQKAAALFRSIPDRHNWAVAVYARGLLYVRQDRLDQIPEIADALSALRNGECSRSVEETWRQARESAARREKVAEEPAGTETQPTPEDIPDMNISPLPPPPPPPAPERASGNFVHLLAIVALVAAGIGGWMVFRLGGVKSLEVFVVAFPLAALVYIFIYAVHKPYEIPAQHVALSTTFGRPRLLEGPGSFRRLPIFQRVRAIIPVYPLTYIFQKQKIPAQGGSVEIGLMVRYQVDYEERHRDKATTALDRICRALDCARDATPKSPDRYQVADRKTPLGLEDMQPLWQRKLAQDIKSTLYQILPEKVVADKLDDGRKLAREGIQTQLQMRTEKWGIAIERVDIAELSKAKD